MPFEQDDSWTVVARMTKLAEAGFFSHLLAEGDIESRVVQGDDFHAVEGRWESVYVIEVPTNQAELAAQKLDEELAQSSPEANRSSASLKEEDRPALVLFWPLILMIMATGMVYWAAQGVGKDQRDHPAGGSLWQAIRQVNRPLLSPAIVGQPAYRLRFDPQKQVVFLDEDTDGDGQYDLHRAFPGQGAAP